MALEDQKEQPTELEDMIEDDNLGAKFIIMLEAEVLGNKKGGVETLIGIAKGLDEVQLCVSHEVLIADLWPFS